jgi:hypothetical protein
MSVRMEVDILMVGNLKVDKKRYTSYRRGPMSYCEELVAMFTIREQKERLFLRTFICSIHCPTVCTIDGSLYIGMSMTNKEKN